MSQNFPREYLHILLYIAWLGIREAHDDLEELLAVCLGFGYSKWSESFEVATNAIFLFDSKAHIDQLF